MKFGKVLLVIAAALTLAAAARWLWEQGREPGESNSLSQDAPSAEPQEPTPQELTGSPDAGGTQTPPVPATTETAPMPGLRMEPAAEGSGQVELRELLPKESEVEWEEAAQHRRLDDSRLSDAQQGAVQDSPVPVLLPDRDDLLQTAIISTGTSWYAAAMKDDGVSLEVSGNSIVLRAGGVDLPEPPPFGEHELSVSRSEGIVDLYFKAYGVYYNITVECFDPFNDPRCAQDAYTLDLADGLLRAAGERRP